MVLFVVRLVPHDKHIRRFVEGMLNAMVWGGRSMPIRRPNRNASIDLRHHWNRILDLELADERASELTHWIWHETTDDGQGKCTMTFLCLPCHDINPWYRNLASGNLTRVDREYQTNVLRLVGDGRVAFRRTVGHDLTRLGERHGRLEHCNDCFQLGFGWSEGLFLEPLGTTLHLSFPNH